MRKRTKRAVTLMLGTIMLTLWTFTGCAGSTDTSQKEKIVFITNNLGDMSISDNTWAGVQEAGELYGYDTSVVECGTDQTKYESFFNDIAAMGTNYIVSTSNTGFYENVLKCAERNPRIRFIMVDVNPLENVELENLYCITFKQNEGAFLAGCVAAAVSRTGRIGLVNSQEYPVKNDFTVGFIDGVKTFREDATVTISVVGSLNDTAKAKELSLMQIESGVDCIFQIAAGCGIGVYSAAAEKGIYAIGVDTDQYEMLKDNQPELADVIITSMLKNVKDAVIGTFGSIRDGDIAWGSLKAYGLKENGVGIAENEHYMNLVDEANRKQIDEFAERVMKNEIIVKTYFQMTEEEYQQYKQDAANE